jgi:hypothetical protein
MAASFSCGPPDLEPCPHNVLTPLPPGQSRSGSAKVFWGSDGLAFERPGRHRVEVIILWQVREQHTGVSASDWVWIDYPTDESHNRVAALMLHPEVGAAVAMPHCAPSAEAHRRLLKVFSLYPAHPACTCLPELARWVTP